MQALVVAVLDYCWISLIIPWRCHAMYFHYIYSPITSPYLLPDPSSPLSLPILNFISSLFFLNPLTSFWLLIYFYVLEHPLDHDQPDTPFVRCPRLSIAPLLEVETQESLPAPCCNADWSCTSLAQATTAAVSSWVQKSCHAQSTLFCSGPSWFLILTAFLPPLPPEPLEWCGKRKSYPWLNNLLAFILSTLNL